MQIVIYGHSGSGKTTLVRNLLNELDISSIRTSCINTTTFDQLILDAFDKIGSYYTDQRVNKKSIKLSSEMKTKFNEISASLKSQLNQEQTSIQKRIVPVQLTSQRLAEFLGTINCIWIIEDFHKMDELEKTKLSQNLKVFMDNADEYPISKIICIGAVATARELIQRDRELNNRIAEIYVPLMNSIELNEIIEKGFTIINLKTKKEDIQEKIIHYSNNLASVCHQLCLDICYSKKIKRSNIKIKIIKQDDFNSAVKMFLKKFSDTFSMYYEKICSMNKYKEYLKELINSDEDLFAVVEEKKGIKISKAKIIEQTKILEDLCTSDYGEIIRYNPDAKKYSFTNPFLLAFIKMKFAIEDTKKNKPKIKTDYELYGLVKNTYELDEITNYLIEVMESEYINTNPYNFKRKDRMLKINNDYNNKYLPKNVKYQNIKKNRKY